MALFPYIAQESQKLQAAIDEIDMQLLELDCTPRRFKMLVQQQAELVKTKRELYQECSLLNY